MWTLNGTFIFTLTYIFCIIFPLKAYIDLYMSLYMHLDHNYRNILTFATAAVAVLSRTVTMSMQCTQSELNLKKVRDF